MESRFYGTMLIAMNKWILGSVSGTPADFAGADDIITRDRAGGGATFVLYKIQIKESSNKISEEISLVRNGVKLQFNISKSRRRHSRHKE